jgi:F-type H+-transporting ATPase subunit alpha
MSIYAGTQGYLDDVPRPDVSRWETAFLTFIRERKAGLRSSLEKEQKLTPALEADLKAAILEFKEKHFR